MNFFTIWRRELASCFHSSVAYVTMTVFLAMTGWVFLQMVEGHTGSNESLSVLLFKVLVFFWLPVLVTVITMRLVSEERMLGTMETLMTAPVTEAQVILGKYAGALTFLLAVSLPAVSSLFILTYMSPGIDVVDVGGIVGGCLILFCLAALCAAIGLFMSLMTRNQIVAAICCFVGALVPLLAGYFASLLPAAFARLGTVLAADEHVADFARGSIDTRPIAMYLSGTVFMLFTAVRALESGRWR